ncbi:MAG: nucleotidyltransferase domain-containing protein, partial [Epsilonproteobacteria bacterium]|nr:nucleotidyltransferase domain-containing protein [Campylobacterota bacterium]
MKKDEIILFLKEIKPEFEKRGITQIALFGSFAKDEVNIYSDIDIAIKKDRKKVTTPSVYEYFNIINDLKRVVKKRFKRRVDILDLD